MGKRMFVSVSFGFVFCLLTTEAFAANSPFYDWMKTCEANLRQGWRSPAQQELMVSSLPTGSAGAFPTSAAPANAISDQCTTYNWVHVSGTGGRALVIYPNHGIWRNPPAPAHHPDGSAYTRGIDFCGHSDVGWAVYANYQGTIYLVGWGDKWGTMDGGSCVYHTSAGPGSPDPYYGVDFMTASPAFSEVWVAVLSWSHDHEIGSGLASSVYWGSQVQWSLFQP